MYSETFKKIGNLIEKRCIVDKHRIIRVFHFKMVLIPIRVDEEMLIQESQNLLQDDRPPTVLFPLAGSTEVLLLFFTSVEEMVVATITDDRYDPGLCTR